MNNRWIAFFSQTGAEICDIAESLGRWPDLIVTNIRPKSERTIDPRLEGRKIQMLPNKPNLLHYDNVLRGKDKPIVTLHGWLRIVPPRICEKHTIFNGHPGLITEYPELKGKDPQVRTFEGKYPVAGAVIHKVTAGVDEGKVLVEERFNAMDLSLDDLFRILRDRSLYMWTGLLKKVL
tara:strand:+ start:1967 stop:2500 length:534 start_codon:yes stop_codon:yes gene_type:complete